ncbi:hypothetical protein FRC17_006106 [Serendipita sp. 399]|nr:hypothetical protein FRC17_006106 [Serendipita sp. 399]
MTRMERVDALEETKTEMANIPPKIIAQAKSFHAHLQYVITNNSQEKPPPGLQRALDELMDEEKMNEGLRKEVLHDGDARRTLFMMSFERTLKKMVENAERLSRLIEERESLERGIKLGEEEEALGNEGAQEEEESPDATQQRDRPSDEAGGDELGSRSDSKTGRKNWLKLRAGIFATRLHSSSHLGHRPYLHSDGSQSEPQIIPEEDETAESNPTGGENRNKGKGSRRGKQGRRGSKLSSVRFADNPYDEQGEPNETGRP